MPAGLMNARRITGRGFGVFGLAMALTMLPATPAASSQPSAARNRCAPVPRFEFLSGFGSAGVPYSPPFGLLMKISRDFETAYRRACREGLVRGDALFEGRETVLLRNTPEATGAWLSVDRERGSRTVGALILDGNFVTRQRVRHAGTVEELYRAIECHMNTVSGHQQGDLLRCLPD